MKSLSPDKGREFKREVVISIISPDKGREFKREVVISIIVSQGCNNFWVKALTFCVLL
jgi:hypothetical protein